jgi:hypothetical protein
MTSTPQTGHSKGGVWVQEYIESVLRRPLDVGWGEAENLGPRWKRGPASLEPAKDLRALIFILTDSANHLSEIDDWTDSGRYPTLHSSKDGDILRGVLDLLHFLVNLGFPTFFVKVRAHRGELYNEAADRIASMATHDKDVPLLWNAPIGRIIYQFTPDPSDSEDTLYTVSMNDTVKKFIRNQAAMSNLYSSHSPGFTESFLRRPHCNTHIGRDLLGACLSSSSFPEKSKK